jgi:hypothetical protein
MNMNKKKTLTPYKIRQLERALNFAMNNFPSHTILLRSRNGSKTIRWHEWFRDVFVQVTGSMIEREDNKW